jgi:hypothetical protein
MNAVAFQNLLVLMTLKIIVYINSLFIKKKKRNIWGLHKIKIIRKNEKHVPFVCFFEFFFLTIHLEY